MKWPNLVYAFIQKTKPWNIPYVAGRHAFFCAWAAEHRPAQQPHAFVLYAVATTEIDVKGKIFRLQSYVYTSGQHVINRFSMRPRGSGS